MEYSSIMFLLSQNIICEVKEIGKLRWQNMNICQNKESHRKTFIPLADQLMFNVIFITNNKAWNAFSETR